MQSNRASSRLARVPHPPGWMKARWATRQKLASLSRTWRRELFSVGSACISGAQETSTIAVSRSLNERCLSGLRCRARRIPTGPPSMPRQPRRNSPEGLDRCVTYLELLPDRSSRSCRLLANLGLGRRLSGVFERAVGFSRNSTSSWLGPRAAATQNVLVRQVLRSLRHLRSKAISRSAGFKASLSLLRHSYLNSVLCR